MRRLVMGLIVLLALAFGIGNTTQPAAASSPVFGGAKVTALSTDAAKKVTAKGAYANYYGYYAMTYLYDAYYYQYLAYYYNGAYGVYATYYANLGSNYAFAAYVAWTGGY